MVDDKDWSKYLLIMLKTDQLGYAEIATFLVREFWKLVREESVKSQGILLSIVCGNPEDPAMGGYSDQIQALVQLSNLVKDPLTGG